MYTAYFFAKRLKKNVHISATLVLLGTTIIALGTLILIIAMSVLYGFQKSMTKNIYLFYAHYQVVPYTTAQDFNHTVPLDERCIHNIQSFPQVDHIRAYAYKMVLLYSDSEVQGALLKGTTHLGCLDNFVIQGSCHQLLANEVCISKAMAQKNNLCVGDTIRMSTIEENIRYRKLKIRGIYQTGFKDVDASVLFCNIQTLRKLNKWPENVAGGYEIIIKNEVQHNSLLYRHLLKHLDYDLHLKSTKYTQAALFDWLVILKKNITIFLWLLFIVIIISITSIIVIQMAERSTMLGLLAAMGISYTKISSIFLWRSLSFIIPGMFWGNALAYAFCYVQYKYKWIILNAKHYYLHYLPVEFDFFYVLMLNIFALLFMLCIIALCLLLFIRFLPIKIIQFKN